MFFTYPIPPLRILNVQLLLILVLKNILKKLNVLNHLWYNLDPDFHLKTSYNLPSTIILPVLPLNPQLRFILILEHRIYHLQPSLR